MNAFFYGTLIAYIVLAAITIGNVEGENRTRYTTLKTMASLLFIALGLAAYRASGHEIYKEFLPAYMCCFAGDICLAAARDAEGRLNTKLFMMGLGSFALAHIFFIRQFFEIQAGKISLFAIVFAVIVPIGNIIASKSPKYNYGKKIIACIIYGVLIGMVGGFGIDFMINGDIRYIRFIGISAFVFMCSDAIIAIKYFRKNTPETRKILGKIELTLYYIAMLGLSTFTMFMG